MRYYYQEKIVTTVGKPGLYHLDQVIETNASDVALGNDIKQFVYSVMLTKSGFCYQYS